MMLTTILFVTLPNSCDRLINYLTTSTSSSFDNKISYNKKKEKIRPKGSFTVRKPKGQFTVRRPNG